MDTAMIALLITAVLGPASIKVLDFFLSRGQKKIDLEKDMRSELRQEIEKLKNEALLLKEELRNIEKELDTWKAKYFLLMEEYLTLKTKIGEQDVGGASQLREDSRELQEGA